MKPRIGKKIVLLGMMTKIPVSGVVWQNIHYLIGLERLGYEAYYVETHARTPSMLMADRDDHGSTRAAEFIGRVMRRFGLGDRWAFIGLHDDGGYYGMSKRQLHRLYDSASLLINLHGGTKPLPEFSAKDRLVYLETDPVQLQVELFDGHQWTIDLLEQHCAYFTFAENYGQPDCLLPKSSRFPMRPTRQPVVIDFWRDRPAVPTNRFTTVGNWRQIWREVTYKGDTYSWSKHYEWLKFIDLPARTPQEIELAIASYDEHDQRMLEDKGWHVRDAMEFSTDDDAYRDYIAGSRAEFSVAKDQNVRLRSGWFSDRSATYLAAGRPVVCQDTGFGSALPTDRGLLTFSTLDEAAEAIEAVNGDYERHARAAAAIARDYFSHEVVLGRLLEEVGVERARMRADRSFDRLEALYPADMDLQPLSRRPMNLAMETEQAVLGRPVPVLNPDTASDRPEASIVVVSYDNLLFTRMCLESVLVATILNEYELIVVDNGSTDASREYLEQLAERNPRVRLVLNDSNAGFARACNQGLAIARGDVLMLLNNDTLVAPGWLMRLMRVLEDPAIGLVGPTTNRIGNEAEVATSYRTWSEFLRFSTRREWEHGGELLDISTLTMFCLAMRRDAYERIGPLDQRFEVGMLEDDDYSMRARDAGFRVVCVEDAFVHHFGESSFGKLVSGGRYNELLAENKKRFEEKWGRSWQPYDRRPNPHYELLTERIRKLAAEQLPGDATVVVVSKGDEELLKLGRRRTWHFPRTEDGSWAGHHPADSEEAITQLEMLRESGGQYLILPSTGFWWLDHYEGFRRHLETRCSVVARDDEACVIFALNGR